jgi:hypothetical protein
VRMRGDHVAATQLCDVCDTFAAHSRALLFHLALVTCIIAVSLALRIAGARNWPE